MKLEPIFKNQVNLFEILEDFEGEKETETEFKIISPKKIDNLVLSYKQIVVLLEALNNFRIDIDKANNDDNLWFNFKIDEINVLFEYLEKGIQYNFEGAVNKCISKRLKKKDDDIGSGALELLVGGFNG